MDPKKSKVNPGQVEEAIQAAAAAKEEILSKSTHDRLMGVTPEDIITQNTETEVIKGTAYPSGCWMHAPAHFELFAAADRRLTRVAGLAGLNVKKVEKVNPKLVKGTKLLVIQAASTNDLTAVPVNRYARQSSIWINFIDLLGDAGLTLETGYREWYDVAFVPEGSPLWPGLVIDLGQPKERRLEKKKKKDQAQPAETTTAAKENNDSGKKESEPAASSPGEPANGQQPA
ncbi:MAG TPA: hypothetical protein VGK74_06390 [Symbiobacteriaceae bacterium]|jgi:hypothetical protein